MLACACCFWGTGPELMLTRGLAACLLSLGGIGKVNLLEAALLGDLIALDGYGVQGAVRRAVAQQLGWNLWEQAGRNGLQQHTCIYISECVKAYMTSPCQACCPLQGGRIASAQSAIIR